MKGQELLWLSVLPTGYRARQVVGLVLLPHMGPASPAPCLCGPSPIPSTLGCNPELACLWVVTRAVSRVYTQHLLHAPGLICRRLTKASPSPGCTPAPCCLSVCSTLPGLSGPSATHSSSSCLPLPRNSPIGLASPFALIVHCANGIWARVSMLPVKSLSAHNLQDLHSFQGPHNFSGPTQPLGPPLSGLPDHSL